MRTLTCSKHREGGACLGRCNNRGPTYLIVTTHKIVKLFAGADVIYDNWLVLNDRLCSVLFRMAYGFVGFCDLGVAPFNNDSSNDHYNSLSTLSDFVFMDGVTDGAMDDVTDDVTD